VRALYRLAFVTEPVELVLGKASRGSIDVQRELIAELPRGESFIGEHRSM